MIRTISAILATIGVGWALSAFMGLVIPFAVIATVMMGERLGESGAVMLFVSFQVYCGYFIWIGWAFRALGLTYFVSRRAFWFISAIHHLLWIVCFLIGRDPDYNDQSKFSQILFGYLGFALIASALFIFIDREKNEAEQVEALKP